MILQNFTFPRAIALLDEIPYPPEKIAFLDLETKAYGRKNSHILYLGLIFLENSTWQVRQWLPEEPEEEKTMLQEVLSLLPCFSCLIHYNGNSFDLPVLTKRCSALNLPLDLSQMESVDLYRAFAPLKKLLGFPHLNQRSLENFLGLERTGIFINDLLQLPGSSPTLFLSRPSGGRFQRYQCFPQGRRLRRTRPLHPGRASETRSKAFLPPSSHRLSLL